MPDRVTNRMSVVWLAACVGFTLVAGCDDATSPMPTTASPSTVAAPARAVAPAESAKTAVNSAAGQSTSVPPSQDAARQELASLLAEAAARLDQIADYTYTLRKQEEVDGLLQEPQLLETKIRHEPFSIYLRFLEPADVQGKEAIFVTGSNDGKLIGHGVGLQGLLGTMKLDPESAIAMMGNRHPITNSGMKRLVAKLTTMSQRTEYQQRCTVTKIDKELVDERTCFGFEVLNAEPSAEFPVAKAQIFFDQEWRLPVRFVSHHAKRADQKPRLVEDYTYTKVQFERGLTDKDFDPSNPEYKFP